MFIKLFRYLIKKTRCANGIHQASHIRFTGIDPKVSVAQCVICNRVLFTKEFPRPEHITLIYTKPVIGGCES